MPSLKTTVIREGCPNCSAGSPRELEASRFAVVNYYRCNECGHVWTTDKKTNEILSHVTPLTRTAKALSTRVWVGRSAGHRPAFEDTVLAHTVRDLIADVRRTRAVSVELQAKGEAIYNWQARLLF